MSTIDLTLAWDLAVEPAARLFTAADLEAFPTELPSGALLDYELDNGRLVLIMAPPGNIHGAAQSFLATELTIQGERKGHGKVRTEVGIVLQRNPDSVFGADVVFIAKKSLPLKIAREGYLETIPELVIEIRGKNDSLSYLKRKVEKYLKAGVELVWVVDPSAKTVTIHAAGAEPIVRGNSDTLELTNLIPGLTLTVADIFRE